MTEWGGPVGARERRRRRRRSQKIQSVWCRRKDTATNPPPPAPQPVLKYTLPAPTGPTYLLHMAALPGKGRKRLALCEVVAPKEDGLHIGERKKAAIQTPWRDARNANALERRAQAAKPVCIRKRRPVRQLYEWACHNLETQIPPKAKSPHGSHTHSCTHRAVNGL